MCRFPGLHLPIAYICSHWVSAIHSYRKGRHRRGPDVGCLPYTGELGKGQGERRAAQETIHPREVSVSSYSRIKVLTDLSDCVLSLWETEVTYMFTVGSRGTKEHD